MLEWIERYLQIETLLELDSAEWQCPVARPRRLRRPEDTERLADEVRQEWNLGLDSIPNITELLEEKGLKVLTVTLPNRVSGFTCLVKRNGQSDLPVVVVNNQFSLERRRLTLVHELAHRLIDTDSLSPKGMFVRERSPRGEVSGQWPRNKDLRPIPRRRGLS